MGPRCYLNNSHAENLVPCTCASNQTQTVDLAVLPKVLLRFELKYIVCFLFCRGFCSKCANQLDLCPMCREHITDRIEDP